MLKKTAIAAGTIAAALVAFQPAANAGGKVHLNFGFGNAYGHGHWGHGHYDPYYTPSYHGYHVMPRWKLFRKLKHRGYYDFHRTYRKGAYYKVRAVRRGKLYKLTVDGRSGRIVRKRRIG